VSESAAAFCFVHRYVVFDEITRARSYDLKECNGHLLSFFIDPIFNFGDVGHTLLFL
jgi:hypothetical protein